MDVAKFKNICNGRKRGDQRVKIHPHQAASVLAQIKIDALEKQKKVWPKEEEEKFRSSIEGKYEKEGDPFHSSARLWDDGNRH